LTHVKAVATHPLTTTAAQLTIVKMMIEESATTCNIPKGTCEPKSG
jgi:hypothetical protein